MVIEECAELIETIQKYRRKRITSTSVIEGAVDVELCLEQLKLIIYLPASWRMVRDAKLKQLKDSLNFVEGKEDD